MAFKALPSPEVLRQLLRYEPETGKLFGLSRDGNDRFNKRWAGSEAFTAINKNGYKSGSINARSFLAHRVVWAIMMGAWPDAEIDHRDTKRANNRWNNLRQASAAENSRNRNLRSDNTCRTKGLSRATSGRWVARIMTNGVAHYLGTFNCQTAAAVAYAKNSIVMHGSFGRTASEAGVTRLAAALVDTPDEVALRAGDLVIRQRDAACRG